MLLFGIAAHVGKGEHRYRGRVGQHGGPGGACRSEGRWKTVLAYIADETHAFARQGADKALRLPTIADRVTRSIYPYAERGLGYSPAVPHRIEDIVPRDHPIAVPDEELQKVEDLRLKRNQTVAASQLAPLGIEDVTIK